VIFIFVIDDIGFGMGQNMMPPPLKGGKGICDHGSEGVLNPVLMGVHPDVGHKSRAMYNFLLIINL
jgi:hypothetical protein